MTEQISDHTLRVDPFGMNLNKQKFYAPDPDQAVPASYKLTQTFEPYNQPNAVASRPIEISFIPAQHTAAASANSAPVAAPLIQFPNSMPQQQQLSDTYALPISNQPQLQQHLLQQQSMLQNMPVSVYNPTYLVQQSNNLLKQHREQLFKPAPAYLGTINQPTIDLSPNNAQPLADVNSVASPGQILASAQSQHKQEHHHQHEQQQHHQHEQQQQHQHEQQQQQEPLQQQLPQSPQQQSNSISLHGDFASSLLSSAENTPTFERYVAERQPNIVFAQQSTLTESELNNLLNIGNQHADDEANRFIASTYYQSSPPDPQVEIENQHRQKVNDLTIAQANEELKDKFNSIESTKSKARKPTTSAHQEHQQKLAEQFTERTPLRIYVPDEDYQKVK